jgi:hypothetical protein
MSSPRNRLRVIAFIVGLLAVVELAPRYLLYGDRPIKADAVVVYLGPDFTARKMEAERLVNAGYARYLIVPAYRGVSEVRLGDHFVEVERMPTVRGNGSGSSRKHEGYLEDTHRETLIARELMQALGAKSAIFVSSPYHMRRIKIIADRVFGADPGKRVFVGSRYETVEPDTWWLRARERWWVFSEYVKILWFQLYTMRAIQSWL